MINTRRPRPSLTRVAPEKRNFPTKNYERRKMKFNKNSSEQTAQDQRETDATNKLKVSKYSDV